MAVAAITGASSGIGAVFARKLAARGWHLLLIARRADRLAALAEELEAAHGIRVETMPADLADSEQLESAARRLALHDSLELLINNAGFGTIGTFAATDYARQEEMHRLHVMATLRLTRAALDAMAPRGRGGIINVSSVAGFFRSPGNVSYCATKGWMNDFSEGLYLELTAQGSPIVVQALCPGFTYTEFHDTMGVSRDPIPRKLWMDANFVVEQSLAGLARRRLFVIPGWRYRLFVAIATRLPLALRLAMQGRSPHRRGRT